MSIHILVVAAHPDDELLGLGGTLARHAAHGDKVTIALVADARSVRYEDETLQIVRRSAIQAAERLGVRDVRFIGLPDQRLDILPVIEVTQQIEAVLREVQPQIIYTHHRGDINRDHQVVHEATLTATRPYSTPYVQRILCYETPSATEWCGPFAEHSFIPNVFVDITNHLESKLHAMSAYTTELRSFPHPRSLEALRIRAAYWGSIIGVEAAEPFVLVREVYR
jgi:LmbE family N-acetylglucosaminyl deacetylase